MILAQTKNDIICLIQNIYKEFIPLDIASCIVPSSIPIIWFGNLAKYIHSDDKIITVSLNPSNNEFGNLKKGIAYNTQYRFPDYDGSVES